ncbi:MULTISPECIES: hypothetical protein [unclassified Streptomyces]|uniref:hypothetical protein n=1 Tax=unclassified Streptomyces TaxID=2593676 RepID=UPI0036AB7491
MLCTVTSEGNLARFELTGVRQTGSPVDPPAFSGNLTLWKVSGWPRPGRPRHKLAW